MSVLIRGMEMPKNCAECQFSDVFAYPPDYDDEWICELHYFSMNWEDAQMRHSNCPLVEVATPHGKLIDADAINHEDEIWKKKCIPPQVVYNAWVVAGEMPTIIEAEDGT